jgi:hypothetical protein
LTADEVSQALGLRHEGDDLIYALPTGEDCIVLHVLTSSDQVDSAQEQSGELDSAVATNSEGSVGLEFGGPIGPPPEKCVGPAEDELNKLLIGD